MYNRYFQYAVTQYAVQNTVLASVARISSYARMTDIPGGRPEAVPVPCTVFYPAFFVLTRAGCVEFSACDHPFFFLTQNTVDVAIRVTGRFC